MVRALAESRSLVEFFQTVFFFCLCPLTVCFLFLISHSGLDHKPTVFPKMVWASNLGAAETKVCSFFCHLSMTILFRAQLPQENYASTVSYFRLSFLFFVSLISFPQLVPSGWVGSWMGQGAAFKKQRLGFFTHTGIGGKKEIKKREKENTSTYRPESQERAPIFSHATRANIEEEIAQSPSTTGAGKCIVLGLSPFLFWKPSRPVSSRLSERISF